MNNHEKITKEVLARIEGEQLVPKARWRFATTRVLLWIPGVITTVLGGFVMSVMIFDIDSAGWRYWGITHSNLGSFFIDSLPYLWIVTFALFMLVSIELFKKTDHGYKYNPLVLASLSIVTSMVLGIFGHLVGLGSSLDHRLAPFSMYRGMEEIQVRRWDNPEAGRLIGVIKMENGATYIEAPIGEEYWLLSFEDSDLKELPFVQDDAKVRLIGFIKGEEEFHVCLVFPWEGPYKKEIEHAPYRAPDFGLQNARKIPAVRINNCSDLGASLQFYQPNIAN